jgi:hypothetical protein
VQLSRCHRIRVLNRAALSGLSRCFTSFSSALTAARAPRQYPKLLPAGTSNIADFLDPRENLFYVDKAAFIPLVEKAAHVAVLLRPKRWGKSTFLNLLIAYYDSTAAPLVHVPGGNTPFAHSFTVLKLDLANVARALSSQVVGADVHNVQERTAAALDAEIRRAIYRATEQYGIAELDMMRPPIELLQRLGGWAEARGAPLYVFVDEYDAVLRSFAISCGTHFSTALAGRQGPLREFFGRFKFLLDCGLVKRVFMTG